MAGDYELRISIEATNGGEPMFKVDAEYDDMDYEDVVDVESVLLDAFAKLNKYGKDVKVPAKKSKGNLRGNGKGKGPK
jgi:hypothetical protein